MKGKILSQLVVLGDPIAQARHRHTTVGKFVRTYDPHEESKKTFASIVQQHAPAVPYDIPLRVDLTFYMARPNSHYFTGKKAGVLKPNAPVYHTGKKDIDNLEKKVFDSLNKIFWKDDGLICVSYSVKKYDEKPRTEIVIIGSSNISDNPEPKQNKLFQ